MQQFSFWGLASDPIPKSEGRDPLLRAREGENPKAETEASGAARPASSRIRASGFGFLLDFGFRASDFKEELPK
jgi:hypothetical protein